MTSLSKKELDIFANKILEDYDFKNPGAHPPPLVDP